MHNLITVNNMIAKLTENITSILSCTKVRKYGTGNEVIKTVQKCTTVNNCYTTVKLTCTLSLNVCQCMSKVNTLSLNVCM